MSIIPPCTCLLSAPPANHDDDHVDQEDHHDDQEDHDNPDHLEGFSVNGHSHGRQNMPTL